MVLTYPASDYDYPERLVTLLGSFWANTYEGGAAVQAYAWARARVEQQSHDNLLEGISALARRTVPLAHTQRWGFVRILESDRNASEASLLRYGDAAVYGYQPSNDMEYKYGVPFGLRPYIFPLPPDLKDVPLLCNRITAPSRVLVRDVDFTVDKVRGALLFREDPFADDLLPRREIFLGDTVVDREIGLWAAQARYDYGWIHEHWGYVLGIDLPSTPGYRDLLNAFLDGLAQGTDRETIQDLLTALTGIPRGRVGGEAVEDIVLDGDHRLVVTTSQAYKLPAAANLLVAIGDTIQTGQPLCDTVQIYELNRGQGPDLSGLSLDKSYLVGPYRGSLQFNNLAVPLIVTSDAGVTRAEFEIGGDPQDVRRFWNQVHAAGVAAGRTLAQMLDQRSDPVGQPHAINLPSTINPLDFLFENFFRNNLFVITIRVSDLGERALGLRHLRLLRQLTPPHTSSIVVLELAIEEGAVIMEGPGTETSPGYGPEEVTMGPALSPLAEAPLLPPVEGRPRMRPNSVGCL